MNQLIESDELLIEDMIFKVRGLQVMLSSDVAKLYHVETKVLNQTIKRNINRFPSSFCFQLTNEESRIIWSQIVTKKETRGGRYLNPYVLTEQGILMLSGLLKSDIAVKVNIEVINAFVKMRRYFANNITSNEMLVNHENRLLSIEKTLNNFKEKEIKKIFFKNELYDSYSLLIDIFNKAKEEIIIIDNYAGKELLDIFKDINKRIIIVSKNIDDKLKNKYEMQYKNNTFINNNSFHDRFIILDRSIYYTCGSSLKDIGKSAFAIVEFNDVDYLNRILKELNI